MKFGFILMLFISQSIFAQKAKVKTAYYPNGKTKSIDSLVDGKKNGVCIEYDENDNGYYEITFQSGVKQGPRIGYRKGQKVWEGNYVNGKLEGLVYAFMISDSSYSEIQYVHGEMNGEAKYFYASGKIMGINNFKDGRPNGLSRTWYKSGILEREEIYFFGQERDIAMYFEDGKRKVYFHFDTASNVHDTIINFYPSGKMANFHVNRWRDSTWWYYSKGWREDGTVMQIDTNFIADGFFYHDVKNWNFPDELYFWQRDSVSVLKMKTGNFTEGFQRKYYENGYLESETMDSAGMKNGEYKEWHVNGQLKLRQHFLKGKQTGKEEEWSDAANLVLEANWRNDSVIHRNQWNENGILFAAFDRPDKNDSVNFVEYSYDDSGKVVWIYKTFLNEGNEHSTYFYPDGKVKSDKAFYSKGFKGRGFDYQYDSTGKVSSGEISKVRLLCGKEVVKKYYPNGSRASKSKTRYRKKLGKRTDYETGREKIHFISWYPSGKKHVKEKYLSGENVFWDEYIYRGRKKVWDENGKMTEKRKLGDGDKPGNENDEEATSPRVKF